MKIVLKQALAAVAFAVCVAGVVSTQVAQAASASSVINVVNMEVVLTQSKVGQNVASQLQGYSKSLQADAKKASDSLQADAKKLAKDRALMQPADAQKKYQALQQREADYQRKFREKGQELQLADENARNKIMEALQPIIIGIMKKNGANIVIDRASILLSTPDLDITKDVLAQLDAKLTSLVVKPIPLASLQQNAPAAAKPAAAKPAQ